MAGSRIKIKIEKSLDNITWTGATGSFISSSITLYDVSGNIISGYNNRPLNNVFPSSYSSSDTLYIVYNTFNIIGNSDNKFISWNINPKLEEDVNPLYYYRLSSSIEDDTGIKFNPTAINSLNNIPKTWTLNIDNPNFVSNIEFTTTGGKFWDFFNGNKNQIVLVSDGGNKIYFNNTQDFIQSQLPYNTSLNQRFKGNQEPIDTQFPNITDIFEILPGDEIRFENNETKTYSIISVDKNVTTGTDRLLLTLDRNIGNDTNKDFFLIRRYKESPDNIIINQTFPYTNPLPSASLAPSTTGFIFPKYPIDSIATGSDRIIRDLIDKKIIE